MGNDMPKISREHGPSSITAAPGDLAEQADGRISALHPAEQNALHPTAGEDKDAWLKPGDPEYDAYQESRLAELHKEERGPEWAGDNSSRSSENDDNSEKKTNGDAPKPAPTTENHSSKTDAGNSAAASAGGATKASTKKA